MSDHKRMDIKEFREFGYLQEVNRQFFHPLGLALEVIVEDDGSMRLGGIWDERDDPEGFCFGGPGVDPKKAERVEAEREKRGAAREANLGHVVQPIDSSPSSHPGGHRIRLAGDSRLQ